MNRNVINTLFVASAILLAPTGFQASASETSATKVTPVTNEYYSLAETQVIIASYVKKIAAATNTNGMGVWMNNKKGVLR